MEEHRIDSQLLKFRRQYFQLFDPDFLAWPPRALLRDAGLQQWIYRNLFDTEQNRLLPPERFQFRVLKLLVAKIEKSFENPEEDVGHLLRSHRCISLYIPAHTSARL